MVENIQETIIKYKAEKKNKYWYHLRAILVVASVRQHEVRQCWSVEPADLAEVSCTATLHQWYVWLVRRLWWVKMADASNTHTPLTVLCLRRVGIFSRVPIHHDFRCKLACVRLVDKSERLFKCVTYYGPTVLLSSSWISKASFRHD